MEDIEYKKEVKEMYKEACREPNSFLRKLKIAFCFCLLEDKELLEELAKH